MKQLHSATKILARIRAQKTLAPATLLALGITALVSGCTSGMSSSSQLVAPLASYDLQSITPSSSTNSTNWNCPDTANIEPNNNFQAFTVCPSTSNTTGIIIKGASSTLDATTPSGQICVFPAEYVDDTHIYTTPSGTANPANPGSTDMSPLYQCTQDTPTSEAYSASALESHQTTLNFNQDISYNAVFIVDAPNAQAMQTCLVGGQNMFCPNYSFGRFRN